MGRGGGIATAIALTTIYTSVPVAFSIALWASRRFASTSRRPALLIFALFVSFVCCVGGAAPSLAQDTSAQGARTLDNFDWRKDVPTGNEFAVSRGDSSFNFFDVGDLSYYS